MELQVSIQLEAGQRKLLDDYWKQEQWSKKEERS